MAPEAKETCCLVCQFSEMNISVGFVYEVDISEDEEEEEEPETEAEIDEEIEPDLPNVMKESKIAGVDEQDTQKELALQIPISGNEQLVSNPHDLESRMRALEAIVETLKLELDELREALLVAFKIKLLSHALDSLL